MQAFHDHYMDGPARVLEVGSKASQPHDTYRSLFDGCDYLGLDVVAGPNVDYVPADAFHWAELEDESFDVVISGQMLEHNPYPWITFAEIARVLKKDGLVCTIAPSAGPVHRHPLDCWRFYPDSASAFCAYVGLDLVESYVESGQDRMVKGHAWGDHMMIARRTSVDPERLASIVALRVAPPQPAIGGGPASDMYEDSVRVTPGQMRRHRVEQAVRLGGHRILKRVGLR